MALASGFRLGPYEILAEIGAGGMGVVYRARDSKLSRDVAIKVLPESFARDTGRMLRFQREAKLLAALNHKNIASIYGVEDSNGSLALVMEYVDGPTLADRIRAGPIPVDEALPIARQIADALEYAHEHGIVHRDLKPANVKVTPDDDVKVLDFGLAKAVQVEASDADIGNSPTISQMATQAGILLGTAAYMSPEQAKGKPVDRRADIWAFGCVLYEMLTGKMAFRGDSVPETLAAILSKDPDWSLLPSATPIRVRVLLQRCLQKDAKQRLRDIGDARISLDEVLTGARDPALAGTALDASAQWRRALPWALAALLFVTSAWLAFIHFREKPAAPAESVSLQIALPEKIAYASNVALSPDGRHLAFESVTQDGRNQLWVRDLDSLLSRPLPGVEDVRSLFWSPDSRTIAFESGSKLERVDISGGAPQVICNVDSPNGLNGGSWNPDGVIVFGALNGIMKVSASGGTPSLLIRPDSSRGTWVLGYPKFLPDGRRFLYSGPLSKGSGVFLGSLDAGSEQQPGEPLAAGIHVAYTPSVSGTGPGRLVFDGPDLRLMTQVFDASRAKLEGNPIPLAEGVSGFTVSDNGVLAYTKVNPPLQLTWFDRQGKVLGTIGEPGFYRWTAISPDDRTAAVSFFGWKASDIWLYDLATGKRSRFTLDGRFHFNPVWSPDGSLIAFTSTRDGISAIYQKAVNGMGGEEPFENVGGDSKLPLDWSRDGRYLIELNGSASSVWVLPLSPEQTRGDRKSILYLNDGFPKTNAKLSRDGQWIAYDSAETGRNEIFVQTFPKPGGKWQISANGGTRPIWSRDGRELYFIGLDGELMAVEVKSGSGGGFEAGAPKALFLPRIWPRAITTFDVARDGRFLIPVVIGQAAVPITVVVNWQSGLK